MKTLFIIILSIFVISTANSQWFQQTSGTSEDLYSISSSLFYDEWACGNNGTVLRSTNLGDSWQSLGGGVLTGLPLYNICGINSATALVTGSDGTGTYVYRTSNAGANWTQVFFQAGGFINVIKFGFNDTYYMQGDPVGGRWSLWKSTNSGQTWDSSGMYLPQAGSEAGWNNSMYVEGNVIYFGTNNSRIYKGDNGGTLWSSQITPELNTYTLRFIQNSINGICGGTQLMRTTNNGNNWLIHSAPGTGIISGSTGAQSVLWFVRQGPGLYSSYDEGETWGTDTIITGASFNDMSIRKTIITDNPQMIGDYRIWAVGNAGVIYATDVLLNGIIPISSNTPNKYSLSQNYPNPFNPTSKIKFDITKADFVSLKVYNTLGKEVSKLVDENLSPGTYEVTFDGAGINSGIYFYTIKSGDFVQTKKMVLLK